MDLAGAAAVGVLIAGAFAGIFLLQNIVGAGGGAFLGMLLTSYPAYWVFSKL